MFLTKKAIDNFTAARYESGQLLVLHQFVLRPNAYCDEVLLFVDGFESIGCEEHTTFNEDNLSPIGEAESVKEYLNSVRRTSSTPELFPWSNASAPLAKESEIRLSELAERFILLASEKETLNVPRHRIDLSILRSDNLVSDAQKETLEQLPMWRTGVEKNTQYVAGFGDGIDVEDVYDAATEDDEVPKNSPTVASPSADNANAAAAGSDQGNAAIAKSATPIAASFEPIVSSLSGNVLQVTGVPYDSDAEHSQSARSTDPSVANNINATDINVIDETPVKQQHEGNKDSAVTEQVVPNAAADDAAPASVTGAARDDLRSAVPSVSVKSGVSDSSGHSAIGKRSTSTFSGGSAVVQENLSPDVEIFASARDLKSSSTGVFGSSPDAVEHAFQQSSLGIQSSSAVRDDEEDSAGSSSMFPSNNPVTGKSTAASAVASGSPTHGSSNSSASSSIQAVTVAKARTKKQSSKIRQEGIPGDEEFSAESDDLDDRFADAPAPSDDERDSGKQSAEEEEEEEVEIVHGNEKEREFEQPSNTQGVSRIRLKQLFGMFISDPKRRDSDDENVEEKEEMEDEEEESERSSSNDGSESEEEVENDGDEKVSRASGDEKSSSSSSASISRSRSEISSSPESSSAAAAAVSSASASPSPSLSQKEKKASPVKRSKKRVSTSSPQSVTSSKLASPKRSNSSRAQAKAISPLPELKSTSSTVGKRKRDQEEVESSEKRTKRSPAAKEEKSKEVKATSDEESENSPENTNKAKFSTSKSIKQNRNDILKRHWASILSKKQ